MPRPGAARAPRSVKAGNYIVQAAVPPPPEAGASDFAFGFVSDFASALPSGFAADPAAGFESEGLAALLPLLRKSVAFVVSKLFCNGLYQWSDSLRSASNRSM